MIKEKGSLNYPPSFLFPYLVRRSLVYLSLLRFVFTFLCLFFQVCVLDELGEDW